MVDGATLNLIPRSVDGLACQWQANPIFGPLTGQSVDLWKPLKSLMGTTSSHRFDTLPHAGPPRWETGLQRAARTTEPDAKVLEEIYTHELLWRLPRVES